MFELDIDSAESVGGGSLFSLVSILTYAERALVGLGTGVVAGGATLRNYYGEEATLNIFAAGNMGA